VNVHATKKRNLFQAFLSACFPKKNFNNKGADMIRRRPVKKNAFGKYIRL
jgi:hypothetical protein